MDASLAAPRRTAIDAPRRRLAALAAEASFEIAPNDALAGPLLREHVAPGRTVFVNHAATATHHAIVAAAARLRRAGFAPVPHLAARRYIGFTQVRDFLQRAVGEAGVEEVLIVGGDPERPLGGFASSLDVLASGLVEQSGIRRVALAGYPDGHPRIAPRDLDAALSAKLELARRAGLEARIVTQFGFSAGAIHRWVAAQRGRGIDCPVHVGIAGPASVATLVKFAVRCGVAASLRALARGHTAFARILAETGPDELLAALLAEEPAERPLAGLHLFTFGGVGRTAAWLRQAAADET